jgi:hypothetical protein
LLAQAGQLVGGPTVMDTQRWPHLRHHRAFWYSFSLWGIGEPPFWKGAYNRQSMKSRIILRGRIQQPRTFAVNL